MTKDKPKEKFDCIALKKSTIAATATSTIQQPLKAVTGGASQSRRAVVSVFEQLQQFERIQEDIPVGSDSIDRRILSKTICRNANSWKHCCSPVFKLGSGPTSWIVGPGRLGC